MKLGIFGGTFNPIHNGHIHLLGEYLEQLRLDRVLLIPTNQPPHKPAQQLASGEHRFNMCRIAVKGMPQVEVSDLELRRQGSSYTVDTLRQLRRQYPQDTFYLLMGGDMFLTIEQWHDADEILSMAVICAGARSPGESEGLRRYAAQLAAKGAKTEILDLKPIAVSSTRIRGAISQGGDTARLVDPQVYDYIGQNGLYGCQADQYPWDLSRYNQTIEALLKPRRYHHSICVAKEAVGLARRYGASTQLAYVAGLLHDVCKNMTGEEQLQWAQKYAIISEKILFQMPQLWHSMAAPGYLRDVLNIQNLEILNAVRYHTTGRANMSLLEKVIYLADLVSEDRDYPDVEQMRQLACHSMDEAIKESLVFTVKNLRQSGTPLTLDTMDMCRQYGVAF